MDIPEDRMEEFMAQVRNNSKNNKKGRRRMDDVDYWRAKAGWYDDDYTMTQYNYGVGGKGGSGSYSSTRRSGPS